MFGPDITPLVKEIQAFKTTQWNQQTQIIALLQEIKEILQKQNETRSPNHRN